MEKDSNKKDESTSTSVMNLVMQYKSKVDLRESMWKEGTRACREQQKAQSKEIERLKETVQDLQTKRNSSSGNLTDDRSNINYKTKWEEAEAKCQHWEKKFHRLETEAIKPLQDKIDQLERDYNQMKMVRDRIAEICACRRLTDAQLEQLRLLVTANNPSSLPIETIANKNDFHQQTLKLRDVIAQENNHFLKQIEDLISKKRKRSQLDDPSSDEEVDQQNTSDTH